MKKILTLFACAAVFAFVQGCGSKKEENKDVVVVEEPAQTSPTLEERRARVKRDREEYAERRRLAAEERAKASATYRDAKGKTVYYVVEEQPTFWGSESELEKYIKDNIKYPEKAREDGIEGTVFVEFVVGADGKVRDVETSEATGDDVKQYLSEEAARVVSSMPDWVPGKQKGKPVDVRLSLPITFQLDM